MKSTDLNMADSAGQTRMERTLKEVRKYVALCYDSHTSHDSHKVTKLRESILLQRASGNATEF